MVLDHLQECVQSLVSKGVVPHLVFVMIGSSKPAALYATRLERLGARTGIRVTRCMLPEDVSVTEFEDRISRLNSLADVDGILVQMPLPEHLTSARLSELIDPRKDVDGITVQNAGRLYLGLPGQTPSTATAIVQILDYAHVDVLGRHAVVVGRSNVVGHPVAELLLNRDVTLTVTHRQTRDLSSFTRQAEVLIVAAGEPGLIQPSMIRQGVVIIDAGINVTPDGVVGDVDFVGCKDIASAITPVPGGVGPVTNAILMRHVYKSAEQRVA